MPTFQIKDVIHPELNEHYYIYEVNGKEYIFNSELEAVEAFLEDIEDLFLMGYKIEVATDDDE